MPTKRSSQPAPVNRQPDSLKFDNLDQQLKNLDQDLCDLLKAIHAKSARAEVTVKGFIAEHSSLFPNMSSPSPQEVLEWLDPDGALYPEDPQCLAQRDAFEPYFNAADYLWPVCDSMPLYLSHCDTPTNRRRFLEGLVGSIETYLYERGRRDLPGAANRQPPPPFSLKRGDREILETLDAAFPETMTVEAIEAAIQRSPNRLADRTIRKRLEAFRKAKLVEQPRGKHGGQSIAEAGKALLASLVCR